MRTQLKGLLSDSVIYGLSGIISSFISIFLIPLYTNVFEPADYGIISILTTTSVVVHILLIFSLDNSAAVWFWDKTEISERKKTFNSWIGFIGFAGLVFAILLALLSRPLSVLFFGKTDYSVLFLIMAANFLFVGFQKVVNIWCRMLRMPVRAMFFSIFVMLITLGFNVLFILILKIGVKGVFFSQLIASFLGVFLMVILFKSWIQFSSFSLSRLKEMLKFSLPLVPANLLYWVMNMASAYFLIAFVKDNTEVGLYQLGGNVANILNLVTWAFFQAWSAFALSVSKQENAKRIYSFVFELYCIVGFFVAFSLMLGSKDILMIFTHTKYLGAATVIGLLAFNVILMGVPGIMSIANNLTKKNTSFAVAIALGSITTVILFLFLIPRYGKEGAALAMIGGNLVVPIYLGYKTQKFYYIPYNFKRIIGVVAMQFILFIIAGKIFESLFGHIISVIVLGTLTAALYYVLARKAGYKIKF